MGFMQDVPRSERFQDVYFNSEDGPGETAHVFFDGNNLPARWQGAERFVIGETGFGTGLNFLLTWKLFDETAPHGAMLDYISVEKYPLDREEIRRGLSQFSNLLSPYLEKFLAKYPMRVPGFHRIVFDGRVALTLIFDDAEAALAEVEGRVDAWFLDGFTPSRNPDMWTDKIFAEIARLSHRGTTLATFTSAGFVKRGLRHVGFDMQKRKGFGFKWSMLHGVFAQGDQTPARKAPTHVAIMGAGLTGCAAAHVLSEYGITPVLYDPHGIAFGASGNSVGLINPRLSALRTPESNFHTAAFAMAAREFPAMDGVEYTRCGSLHLVTGDDKEKRFARALENWGWHDVHMRMVDAASASAIAGLPVGHTALFLAEGGRINPARLCAFYAKGVDVQAGPPAEGAIIHAQGAWMREDPAFADLPLQSVRGQITSVRATGQSARLQTNLCYGGYIAPAQNGVHVIGSTFQKWMAETDPRAEDDRDNLKKLRAVLPVLGEFEVVGHRAALRLSASDRFPVIGSLSGPDAYISAAHGSHGIIATLLGGHILADHIRCGPFCVGKSVLKSLDFRRFSARAARRTA